MNVIKTPRRQSLWERLLKGLIYISDRTENVTFSFIVFLADVEKHQIQMTNRLKKTFSLCFSVMCLKHQERKSRIYQFHFCGLWTAGRRRFRLRAAEVMWTTKQLSALKTHVHTEQQSDFITGRTAGVCIFLSILSELHAHCLPGSLVGSVVIDYWCCCSVWEHYILYVLAYYMLTPTEM